MIPDYSLDGRMGEFNFNTVSATYSDSAFRNRTDHQEYGVRGIGTITKMQPQQDALANARSLVRSAVENVMIPLSEILRLSTVSLPGAITQQVRVVEADQLQMQQMIVACDKLSGDTFTWQQIAPILEQIINPELVFLGDVRISGLDPSYTIGVDERLTFTGTAGVMAHMADFTGNFSVLFSYKDGTAVTVRSSSARDEGYLTEMADTLDTREAATDDGSNASAEIQNLHGYAVDVALRCNANSGLLLQTSPELRVEDALGISYCVDYNKNLRDEGQEVYTPIYTDASWEAMAALVANGKQEVTEYNTITYELPEGADTFEVTYDKDFELSLVANLNVSNNFRQEFSGCCADL